MSRKPGACHGARIEKITFNVIHNCIMASHSLNHAAELLKTDPFTLQLYLSRISINQKPATYDEIKKINKAHLELAFGLKYKTALNLPTYQAFRSLATVHNFLLLGQNLQEIAHYIQMDIEELQAFLRSYEYSGRPLSEAQLKLLSMDDAQQVWGAAYFNLLGSGLETMNLVVNPSQIILSDNAIFDGISHRGFSQNFINESSTTESITPQFNHTP